MPVVPRPGLDRPVPELPDRPVLPIAGPVLPMVPVALVDGVVPLVDGVVPLTEPVLPMLVEPLPAEPGVTIAPPLDGRPSLVVLAFEPD